MPALLGGFSRIADGVADGPSPTEVPYEVSTGAEDALYGRAKMAARAQKDRVIRGLPATAPRAAFDPPPLGYAEMRRIVGIEGLRRAAEIEGIALPAPLRVRRREGWRARLRARISLWFWDLAVWIRGDI